MSKTETIIDECAARILDVVEHMIVYDGKVALQDAKAVRLRVAQLIVEKDADQTVAMILEPSRVG